MFLSFCGVVQELTTRGAVALICSLASTRTQRVCDALARWQRSAFDVSAVSHFSTLTSVAAAAVMESGSAGALESTRELEVRTRLNEVRSDLAECCASIKKAEGQIESVEGQIEIVKAELKLLTTVPDVGVFLDVASHAPERTEAQVKILDDLRSKKHFLMSKANSLRRSKNSLYSLETSLLQSLHFLHADRIRRDVEAAQGV